LWISGKEINMRLLRHLLKLKYCGADKYEELLKYFSGITSSLNIHYIFNPSFYCDEDVKIFAFRAVPNDKDSLTSFLSIEDKTGRSVKNISIDLCGKLNVRQLIDPKVTKIDEEFYVTFNSAWIESGNDIFIMKIYPEMGPPKKVVYGNRQEQERNWAFFSEEGEIYALYEINPLKILKLKNVGPDSWEMEDSYSAEIEDINVSKDLAIGTQLFRAAGNYYFIAHKKLYFMGRKIYLGKLCLFDFNNNKIHPGKYWLAHSFKSLFGSTVKHNYNLFSCTYFSGIQVSNDLVKLGYGVNDVNYGFSRHKLEDL